MAAQKKAAEPSHYEVKLARPWTIPGTTVEIPPGVSTVAAEVVKQMPEEIVLDKTPAEIG